MGAIRFLCTWMGAVLLLGSLFSCREDLDKSQLKNYEGPYRISHNIELLHSDSALVRTKLMAAKQLEYLNQDTEFPEGIVIHFFDKEGTLSTTIRADRGYYDRKNNLYRGEGDVQVENLQKEQKLSSEELFWDPGKEKIYTEKFVTVEEPDRIIKGTGMEADEGFNEYTFNKVTGVINNAL
ncbi:LPS export ABC transporter periplasmic protein LptC [Cyclobacterium jeungdonense]|uniref:LPS export ABC transporter periplasmic protein LptC n=1 Tax=Cyclobacterium jeungdonense TaxID=708087 RepID=A0ABT8C5D4_9BACT|nr:LPS export ABC transporter periplasmic protein LptC [Cyclobacterium jeungdonense]MDN3688000.1 LPS export ABC transporter periplasmic protein LptC [Cyclobacterium jeungdonense]